MDYPPQQPYLQNFNQMPPYSNLFRKRYRRFSRRDRRGGCL